jgi:hypothetical protein
VVIEIVGESTTCTPSKSQVITSKGKNLPTDLVGGDFLVIRNGLVLRLRNQASETQQEHTRDDHEKPFSHNHFSDLLLREQIQYGQSECPLPMRLFV